jgi:muconate cycloisomerase
LNIVDIKAHHLNVPLKKSYVLSSTYGVLSHAQVILLQITDSDGNVGWGETAPLQPFTRESAAGVMGSYEQYLLRPLLELQGDALLDWWRGLENTWPEQPMARAAVDIALHDLLAKSEGRRVFESWGDIKLSRVPMMGSVGNATAADNAREAAQLKSDGYGAMMIKVGTEDLERDIECIKQVRAATGDDFPLIADANQGWSREQAIEFARAVSDCNLSLFEQPVAADDWEGLKLVREQGGIAVCADESLFSEADARQLIEQSCVDAFSIKVTKHGGLTPARRIMELARENGVPCLMNSMIEQGVAQAASLQLAAVADNLWPHGHAYFSTRRMAEDLTDYHRLYVPEGVRVPNRSGHGVRGVEETFALYEQSALHFTR